MALSELLDSDRLDSNSLMVAFAEESCSVFDSSSAVKKNARLSECEDDDCVMSWITFDLREFLLFVANDL